MAQTKMTLKLISDGKVVGYEWHFKGSIFHSSEPFDGKTYFADRWFTLKLSGNFIEHDSFELLEVK